jgi:hypothetical protein
MATAPDAELLRRFRDDGGGETGTKCVRTVHRTWPNEAIPGELAQVLPTPAHFEQASQLVTGEMIAESVPCVPDAERIVATFQEFADAGFDELYVAQIGPRREEFFDMLARDVLPHF